MKRRSRKNSNSLTSFLSIKRSNSKTSNSPTSTPVCCLNKEKACTAATGYDDDDWDSNSAIVGLAVIRQSVAFPSQGESKRRWPPSCGLRPECIGTNFGHSGKCMWLGRQELKIRLIVMVAVIVIATLQEQAVVPVVGNGGGRQSTLLAKQGDQRAAGHNMMQGGGGGSNLSCQLPAAGATATT